jgi:membrane protease YdiL (CAAX protease family)
LVFSSLAMDLAALPWDYTLILLVLAIFVPWRGTVRVRELLARPRLGTADRVAMYGSTIAFQWLAAGVTAWRVLTREVRGSNLAGLADNLGLALPRPLATIVIGVGLSVALAATQIMSLRALARMPSAQRGPLYEMATRFMPQTLVETLPFLALLCTVSVCEEFLYRGFALLAFARLFHGSLTVAILASSAIFAFGHLYQGRRGVTTTFFLGTVLGVVRAWTGSLAPCVLVHFVIDLVAGLAGPRVLQRVELAGGRRETT